MNTSSKSVLIAIGIAEQEWFRLGFPDVKVGFSSEQISSESRCNSI